MMTSLFVEQSIWTVKDIITVPDSALACRCYREKGKGGSKYGKQREVYEEGRGRLFTLKSRRCGKVLDNLKEIETLLQQETVIDLVWREDSEIQILLDTGCVITVGLSENREDPERLLVDRSLCGHLSSSTFTSGAIGDNIVVSASDTSSLVDIVTFCRPFRRSSAGSEMASGVRKLEKLSALSMKLGNLDLRLPEGFSVRKRIRFNCRCDKIAIWWTTHFWPPSEELRNVTICQTTGGTAKKLFEFTSDHPLVALDFRRSVENELAVGELEQKNKNSFVFHISLHEVKEKEISKRRSVALPLQNAIVSWDPHPREEVFLLRTDNAKCILYDMAYKSSKEVEVSDVAFVRWHGNGLYFFILTVLGDLQAFDLAGTPVTLCFVDNFAAQPKPSVNLLKYFRCNKKVTKFTANKEDCSRWVMLHDGGPLSLVSLPALMSPADLCRVYICEDRREDAVRLLQSLHWNSQPEVCFTALTFVFQGLLTKLAYKENVKLCEQALASFFISKEPLSETVRLEFRERLMLLSRKFFTYLLNFGHMEKAYLLSEDLGHLDLYADFQKNAVKTVDNILAECARMKIRKEKQERDGSSQARSEPSCEFREQDFPREMQNGEYEFEEAALRQFSRPLASD